MGSFYIIKFELAGHFFTLYNYFESIVRGITKYNDFICFIQFFWCVFHLGHLSRFYDYSLHARFLVHPQLLMAKGILHVLMIKELNMAKSKEDRSGVEEPQTGSL